MAVAVLLGQRGIACTVVERRTTAFDLPRAVHLDDESMRVLQELGIAHQLTTRPALGLRLVDADLRTLAQFDRGPGRFGYPQSSMFSQPELEGLLRGRIAALPDVDLRAGVELIGLDGSVRDVATGEVSRIECSHVLGCDGASSTVRELAKVGWRDLGFEERWLVVDGQQQEPLGTWNGVFQVCDPKRAATYMQVAAEHYRWEFRLHAGETAVSVDLAALLRPWGVASDLAIVRRAEYTFRAGLAGQWRRDNVLLLGDAAHQTPPFIGQGLGLGLGDASNLAWKLASGQPLDSYEAERAPHAKALVRKAMLVGWALTGGQDAAAAVRRRALALMYRGPRLMRAALDRGTPALRPGPLVGRGRLAGQRIPQPTTSFDEELGNGFALVLTRQPTQEVAAIARRLGAGSVVAPPAVATWMRRARSTAVIVRPDRVVLLAADRRGRLTAGARRAAAAVRT